MRIKINAILGICRKILQRLWRGFCAIVPSLLMGARPLLLWAVILAGGFFVFGDKPDLNPLHVAARSGNIAEVNRLIDGGTDVNAIAKYDRGSWYLGMWNYSVGFILYLVADINVKAKPGWLPWLEYRRFWHEDSSTALHFAADKGQTAAAIALIKAGADIEAKDDDGRTPLHEALWGRHIKTVNALFYAGADIGAKNNNGMMPLHIAATTGQTEIMLALIKAGADIGAKTNHGWTPLHNAAWQGQTETALALVKAGAAIWAKDNDGETPLHEAAEYGRTQTALALVKAGADIGARDNDGWTPLHLAAAEGKTKTAHALIKAGASLLAETDDNETPLDVAIEEHGKDSVIALFLQKAMAKKGLTNEEKAKKLVRDLE